MKWHERILENWVLRWLFTGMITMFVSALLIKLWSLALNLTMFAIAMVIVYNLREYISDSHAGATNKHDFVGWLIWTVAMSIALSTVVNSLYMLGKL